MRPWIQSPVKKGGKGGRKEGDEGGREAEKEEGTSQPYLEENHIEPHSQDEDPSTSLVRLL